MRENEEKWTEDGAARRKLGRTAGGESSHGIDDVAIPDYDMRDFGLPEEPRRDPDVRHRPSGVLEAGEGLGRSRE